jgi:FKBP-type peptidyl-prolyl cis-trans isomerase
MILTLAVRSFTVIGIGAVLTAASAQESPVGKSPTGTPAATLSQPGAAPATSGEKDQGFIPPAVSADPSPAAGTIAEHDQSVIRSRTDKLSYAAGVDMARDLKRQGDSHAMNVDLFMRALSDALAGRHLLMTDDEAASTMKAFETEQKQDLQHAKIMISERNRRESEAFFAENAKKDGVITLPSGLQYKVLKKGDGKLPGLDDIVLCNYTGKLLDGTEIDSSYKRKEPTTVSVKGVISGWVQALQLMPVGSKWQLFIPPQLAFGDKATPVAGPNSTLIFEVELLSIQEKQQTASTLQQKPQAASAAK